MVSRLSLMACLSCYSQLRITFPPPSFCHPPQLPRQCTVLETGLYHVLPLELAWWWLFRSGLQPGGWVLLLGNKANLAGALAVRAGAGLNLTWGVLDVDGEDVGELDPHVTELQRQVKIADGLPPVNWIQPYTATAHHPLTPSGSVICIWLVWAAVNDVS